MVPWEVVAALMLPFDVSRSVSTTELATAGPRLLTMSVYIIEAPTETVFDATDWLTHLAPAIIAAIIAIGKTSASPLNLKFDAALSKLATGNLELEVKEPVGSVCSIRQKQTPGGGILAGGTLAEPNRIAYLAAQAFPGDYEITVRRVWGSNL